MDEKTFEIKGSAYSRETGRLLYHENHRETWQDEQHRYSEVEYVSAEGETLATKCIDFSNSRIAPDFEMRDTRFGRFGARNLGNKIEVFGPDSEGRFKTEAAMVIDGGFDYFIRDHWQDLETGEPVKINFAVVDRGVSFGFELQKIRTGRLGQQPVTYFQMKIDNWFLKMLVEPIEVAYYSELKRLAQFEGISNIYDERGKNYNTRIVFEPQNYAKAY